MADIANGLQHTCSLRPAGNPQSFPRILTSQRAPWLLFHSETRQKVRFVLAHESVPCACLVLPKVPGLSCLRPHHEEQGLSHQPEWPAEASRRRLEVSLGFSSHVSKKTIPTRYSASLNCLTGGSAGLWKGLTLYLCITSLVKPYLDTEAKHTGRCV